MASAQLPASEAISQQVSEELDTQLPSKLSRIQEEIDSRYSNFSVIPKSSRTQLKKSTLQEQGEITNLYWFSYCSTPTLL